MHYIYSVSNFRPLGSQETNLWIFRKVHCSFRPLHRSLTLLFIFTSIYPLRSKGKDGHSAAAQIASGWIAPLLFRLQSRAYTLWINNCLLYLPPYIRSLSHSRFYCHFVFSVKSDFSRVMRARPSWLFCSLLLRKYHSKCIVSSDWSIHDDRMFSSSRPIKWQYAFAPMSGLARMVWT